MKILFTQVVHQYSHNHLLVHFPLLHHHHPLHEKTPLHKIKCVVKSVLKATFDTPLITFDSRQR